MARDWKLIRVPEDLHGELKALAAHYDRMQAQGKCTVPDEFADPRGKHVGTPLWWTIRKCLDERKDKLRRSRRKRGNTNAKD